MKGEKFKFTEGVSMAEVSFEAKGGDLNELFENAAFALESVQADLKKVKASKKVSLELEAEDAEMLLYDLLNKLVYYKDAESLFFKTFKVQIFGNGLRLKADLWGEELDPQKTPLKLDVKAVTLHGFKIWKENGEYKASVVLDI